MFRARAPHRHRPPAGTGGPTPVRPCITGPARWPAAGDPPEFRVDAAGLPFWMVEMATTWSLMETTDHRSPENYYFGGDVEGVFGTGDRWAVPRQAWRRLGPSGLLYYRLVAFDHGGCGGWAISVDDQHLAEMPRLVVAAVPEQIVGVAPVAPVSGTAVVDSTRSAPTPADPSMGLAGDRTA